MRDFLADLRRRNVVRGTAACIAVDEPVMQLIDNLAPPIRLPRRTRALVARVSK